MNDRLSESAFAALVEAGCPSCGARKLSIEALLVERVPLLAGEVFGSPSWAYKGEDFVHGTYRIACHRCRTEIYSATACPRCGAPGGVARALERVSELPLPRACTSCGSEQLTAKAFAPACVFYEGKRADKPRPQAGPEEPGFHPFEVVCKVCDRGVEAKEPCPLCGDGQSAT
jgi:RNA polymerase subunit RPABC4/transcription elongation factor Spt4